MDLKQIIKNVKQMGDQGYKVTRRVDRGDVQVCHNGETWCIDDKLMPNLINEVKYHLVKYPILGADKITGAILCTRMEDAEWKKSI